MTYTRRFHRKRPMRRRGVRKARPRRTGTTIAQKVVSGLGRFALNRLKSKLGLNTEQKFIDANNAVVATTTLSYFTSATAALIAQGNTASTRSGDQVRMTRFRLQGRLINGAANLNQATSVRIIGVNWRHTPQPSANVADILQASTNIDSCYTMDPAFPHKIIYDRQWAFGPTLNFALPNVYLFDWEYRPLSCHIKWTTGDTTGNEADILEGYIAFYIISYTATAMNFPTVSWYQRIEYVDN